MNGAVLVAGVGNIFLGDDGFGVEVVRSLAKRRLPRNVWVKDFGIRGFDLAYALLDPWGAVILVDALPRGDAPGSLSVVKPYIPPIDDLVNVGMEINPHGMDPVRVLNLALSMGPIAAEVFVVGCEPNDFGDELEGRIGLSGPVQAAVEEAANMVEELAARMQKADALIETQIVEAMR